MYDIIGDIHGYCSKLEELFVKLDYRKVGGVWKHPERKVIFVGDYIDRGLEIKETLRLVRDMVEADSAIALLGNHEFNAVAFATKLNENAFLRPNNAKNTLQHIKTIEQFANDQDEWHSHLNWFYSLPLFLDLGDLRVVHACWDDAHIEWLKNKNYFTLNEELLFAAHNREHLAYDVINDILKGKELKIPEEFAWPDKDGHIRNSNRAKWWVNPSLTNYDEFLFDCPESLKTEKAPGTITWNIYPESAPPVFFGHYWLNDKHPGIQTRNVACLDYSVAKNGALVGYRWNGEKELDPKNFVSIV